MSRLDPIKNAIDDINAGIDDFKTSTGSVIMRLDDFVFGHMEVPKSINFGGDQSLHVHQFVGGDRLIDAMGRNDSDLSWSGVFFGSAALNRARYLDNIRVTGDEIVFQYSRFRYKVVIRHFSAEFEKSYNIPYRITLSIVEDLSLPVTFASPLSYGDAIFQDYQKVLSLADFVGNASLIQSVGVLGDLINSVSDFSSSTPQERINVFDSATDTQNINKSIINETESIIF